MPTRRRSRAPARRLDALAYSYAATARREFTGRNGRVSESGAVHRVELDAWLDGAAAPRPACHVGVDGWHPWRVRATAEPVSCRRCLRTASPSPAPGPEAGQCTLF